jgi:Cft2 family RNA processing exonuclease
LLLTDLNAHGGIGSNSLLVELGPFRFVVDAGLHPKLTGRQAVPRFDAVRRAALDFVCLTHCHLDHLGALPVLLRDQSQVPIIMSAATRLLFRRMLHNSFSVMSRQRDELGIREYPLFTRAEIERLLAQSVALTPGQPRAFGGLGGDTLMITLHPAGHLPGACSLLVTWRHRKILFTGDVLFADQWILPGAKLPSGQIDTLVIETTRGATQRPADSSRASEWRRLAATIRHTLREGGSVLLPVFALGRMQELFAFLEHARANGEIPACPIFASGLGLDIVDHFDEIAASVGGLHFRRRILRDLGITRLPDHHKPGTQGPAIYALSSGMMVANTPAYNVCAKLLGQARHAVCFLGYCDPDSPGGQLLAARHGERFLFAELPKTVEIRARIDRFDLSSHAEAAELIDYAIARKPRSVVLTHGDPAARAAFAAALADRDPTIKIIDPPPLKPVLV